MHPWEREYRNPQLVQESLEPLASVRSLIRQLKKLGFVFKNSRVLDLGCGTGRNMLPFLERGATVTGYDIAPTAIGIAREALHEFSVDSELVVRSIGQKFLVSDNSIDIVLDVTASHALLQNERGNYLREISRVLRSGGYVFIRTLAKEGDKNALALIKKFPGPEPNTYILPGLQLTEHVITRTQLAEDFKDFELISIKKTSGYAKIENRNYKREYWIAVFRK